MLTSNQIAPGMAISINKKLFRVESVVKVTVPKGTPFVKTTLRDLSTNKSVEKNFKLNQTVKQVALDERDLEFLYLEGKDYLFLDINLLDQVLVPHQVIGDHANYLKEGVIIKAFFYGETVFNAELPQFLELMVTQVEGGDDATPLTNSARMALIETGAKIEIPPFIEVGDVIKIDTKTNEYIQRV